MEPLPGRLKPAFLEEKKPADPGDRPKGLADQLIYLRELTHNSLTFSPLVRHMMCDIVFCVFAVNCFIYRLGLLCS